MEKISSQKLNRIFIEVTPKKNKIEVNNMKQHIEKMIKNVCIRAEREVPEYGDFKMVYEEFKNPDKDLVATDFMLKIVKPNLQGHEKVRNLELVAYKLPLPYKANRIIATGSKEEILEKLKSQDLQTELEQAVKELSKNLEDV